MDKKPASVIFFDNGLAAVFDQDGQQMPKYQGAGQHPEVIAALQADGYDLGALSVSGFALEPRGFVDRDGRPISEYAFK